jgi:hypothetical protein
VLVRGMKMKTMTRRKTKSKRTKQELGEGREKTCGKILKGNK